MALLIDIRDPGWLREEDLCAQIAADLPGVPIYCSLDEADVDAVIMAAVVRLHPGVAASLPNLQLVQKLGAGVDGIVRDPDLKSSVQVARLKPATAAIEIADYCLAYVLRGQRHMAEFEAQTLSRKWQPIEPRISSETNIAVLGLGHIGALVARRFAGLGFNVIGWSRSPSDIDNVDCRHGRGALPEILGISDYVASILPSTPETRDLFDLRLLQEIKPGSTLINAGRGDLIVEADLIEALDGGLLANAVLDVFRTEPLPRGHSFWDHPAITITPHVSGWHADEGFGDIATNYKRLIAGKNPHNLVDRAAGY